MGSNLGPKVFIAGVVLGIGGLTKVGSLGVNSLIVDTQNEANAFVARMSSDVQRLVAGKPYKDARGNVYFMTVDGHKVQCYDHPSSSTGDCTHPGFVTAEGPLKKSSPIGNAVSVAFRTDNLGLVLDALKN